MLKFPSVAGMFMLIVITLSSCAQSGIPSDVDYLMVVCAFESGLEKEDALNQFEFVRNLDGVYDIRVNSQTARLYIYAHEDLNPEKILKTIAFQGKIIDIVGTKIVEAHDKVVARGKPTSENEVQTYIVKNRNAEQWRAEKAREFQKNKEEFLNTNQTKTQ